jgi:hypothetical protein
MSRLSNYTNPDIMHFADQKGFDYLDGEIHVNAKSIHQLRCRNCHGKQEKRSRQIVSRTRGRCIFLPCHPRGKPTAAFLGARAAEHGVLLKLPEVVSDPASFVIDPVRDLVWQKEMDVMTQSWNQVHHRYRKTKKFFATDGEGPTRRRARVNVKNRIKSVDDAIACLKLSDIDASRDVDSWGHLYGIRPAVCSELIAVGLKEAFMDRMGWTAKAQYEKLGDEELLRLATRIVTNERLSTVGALEKKASGLTKILRRRNLIGSLCDLAGFLPKASWKGKCFDEILAGVKESKFTSSSHWHECQAGAYKYANEMGWLNKICREMKWGTYLDSQDNGWLSTGECLVADLLIEAGEEFVPNPYLPGAFGPKGGQRKGDFYLPRLDLWIEVWGYFADPEEYKVYKENRANKEKYYEEAGFTLCHMEACIIYISSAFDGVQYRKGQESFKQYARKVLAAWEIPVQELEEAELN